MKMDKDVHSNKGVKGLVAKAARRDGQEGRAGTSLLQGWATASQLIKSEPWQEF